MSIKKLLSTALALIMILSSLALVACDGEDKNSDDSSSETTEAGPAVTFNFKANEAGDAYILERVYWGSSATDSTVIEIPTTYEGKPVVEIGEEAFSNVKDATEVVIPEGIKVIGARAFSGLSKLKTVSIPSSVTTIKAYAFGGCKALNLLNLSEGLEVIEANAFGGCTALANIAIPNSVKQIKINAFSDTTFANHESHWENGLLYCGSWMLGVKNNLKGEVAIKEGTRYAFDGAFAENHNITKVTLPSTMLAISNDMFRQTSIKSINIPDGLVEIGDSAFERATYLESISLPASVKYIGDKAFHTCMSLKNITIANKDIKIEYGAFGDSGFEQYKGVSYLRATVLYIDSYLYRATSTLHGDNETFTAETYTVKDGTYTIGDYAFWGADIKTVVIPKSVKHIGKAAFRTGHVVCFDKIVFNGTKAEWEAIDKAEGWFASGNATVVNCTDGDVAIVKAATN